VTGLVIFDCDGVLIDSDRISLRVQTEMLCEFGVPTSYDACVRDFLGIGRPATLAAITARLGRPVPPGWIDELDQAVRTAFTHKLTPTPGIIEALSQITVPTCIASSGSHAKMGFTLALTNIYLLFEGRIFSGDEVEHDKPAPDLFLHAARTMTTAPARCVVVEDSPSGVQAAKTAGMRVLGYAAATPKDWLHHADVVFADMTDMTDLPALIASSWARCPQD
jgi:HAD superfamily hydrolase (TIGR01509 family)